MNACWRHNLLKFFSSPCFVAVHPKDTFVNTQCTSAHFPAHLFLCSRLDRQTEGAVMVQARCVPVCSCARVPVSLPPHHVYACIFLLRGSILIFRSLSIFFQVSWVGNPPGVQEETSGVLDFAKTSARLHRSPIRVSYSAGSCST